MPLDVRSETTEAFQKFKERFDALTDEAEKSDTWNSFNSELYTVGVAMWVTGVNPLTADNFSRFIDRCLMLDSWDDVSRNELAEKFRPFIGTSTNTSPETRAAFVKRFKDRL